MILNEKLSNEIIIKIYLREKDFIKTKDFDFDYFKNHINETISDTDETNDITIHIIPCNTSENTIEVTLCSFENNIDYVNDTNFDQILKGCFDDYFIALNIPITKYILIQTSSPAVVYTY